MSVPYLYRTLYIEFAFPWGPEPRTSGIPEHLLKGLTFGDYTTIVSSTGPWYVINEIGVHMTSCQWLVQGDQYTQVRRRRPRRRRLRTHLGLLPGGVVQSPLDSCQDSKPVPAFLEVATRRVHTLRANPFPATR